MTEEWFTTEVSIAGNSGLLKRIAQLERTIRLDHARFIFLEINGNQDDKEAQAALLTELAVTPATC
jgi:hypothetical protein